MRRAVRTARQEERPQRSGRCSAQPICGEAQGWCSSVPEETTRPLPSITTARVPPVPTSIPSTKMWPPSIAAAALRHRSGERLSHFVGHKEEGAHFEAGVLRAKAVGIVLFLDV